MTSLRGIRSIGLVSRSALVALLLLWNAVPPKAASALSSAASAMEHTQPPKPKRKAASVGRSTRSTRSTRSRRSTPTRAPAAPVLRFTTPRSGAALTTDLTTLLGSRTRNGTWGAMVVSITRGDTLFAHGAGSKMVPASTMKLFTAAMAFEKLGPEHTFRTDVLRDGPLHPRRSGGLQGDAGALRGGRWHHARDR